MKFFHWLYAHLFGYFWKPCPICGEMFGGHQHHGFLMNTINDGVLVCPKCKKEADRRNDEIYEAYKSKKKGEWLSERKTTRMYLKLDDYYLNIERIEYVHFWIGFTVAGKKEFHADVHCSGDNEINFEDDMAETLQRFCDSSVFLLDTDNG